MKPAPSQINISHGARTFLLLSITLSYHMFSTGFELGAHGELLYNHKITAWSLVTGALVALLILPKQESGIKYWQLVVLLIPSLWVMLASYFGLQNQGAIVKPGLFLLATISYLICLPYAIYIIVQIVNPELLTLKGRGPKVSMIIVSVCFLVLGYLTGEHNYLFMTCEDFDIAGDMRPENCLR
ncbi:MAG: hypothetical protein EP297_10640 [Gammaproteobacteria bacterium]|nr:MAG: hypothetical protein EP297_10640 [Gammaproteobacteria bacterium]